MEKVVCYLLELCFPVQLADYHSRGVLSHVYILDVQRLRQRVAPDTEDSSNPQVQSWYVNPRLRPQRERARGGTSWETQKERRFVFFSCLLLFSVFPPLLIPSFSPHSLCLSTLSPFLLSSFPSLLISPFLSPFLLLLCLSLWPCEEGGEELVGTAAVAPAGEGGWLTGVVEAGLGVVRGGACKALTEREKKRKRDETVFETMSFCQQINAGI